MSSEMDMGFGIQMKYKITPSVTDPVVKKAADGPQLYQMIPAIELASMVHKLCNPENVPIADAVSFLLVIFEIQAFEIPSVEEA